MVSLTRNTLRVAEMVRSSLPRSLLVAGGPLPTVFPRRFAAHFDVVFRGEADLSFPRFCAGVPRSRQLGADDGRAAPRRLRRLVRAQPRPAGRQPDCALRRERARVVPPARQERLRPRRLPGRVAADDRLEGHLDHRHAGLPVRLRLLLQAGLRQRLSPPRPRRGLRRDRADPRPRLRRAVDRRRHLHDEPAPSPRVLPAHGRPADELELPLAGQRHRRRDRAPDEARPAVAGSTSAWSRAARRRSSS